MPEAAGDAPGQEIGMKSTPLSVIPDSTSLHLSLRCHIFDLMLPVRSRKWDISSSLAYLSSLSTYLERTNSPRSIGLDQWLCFTRGGDSISGDLDGLGSCKQQPLHHSQVDAASASLRCSAPSRGSNQSLTDAEVEAYWSIMATIAINEDFAVLPSSNELGCLLNGGEMDACKQSGVMTTPSDFESKPGMNPSLIDPLGIHLDFRHFSLLFLLQCRRSAVVTRNQLVNRLIRATTNELSFQNSQAAALAFQQTSQLSSGLLSPRGSAKYYTHGPPTSSHSLPAHSSAGPMGFKGLPASPRGLSPLYQAMLSRGQCDGTLHGNSANVNSDILDFLLSRLPVLCNVLSGRFGKEPCATINLESLRSLMILFDIINPSASEAQQVTQTEDADLLVLKLSTSKSQNTAKLFPVSESVDEEVPFRLVEQLFLSRVLVDASIYPLHSRTSNLDLHPGQCVSTLTTSLMRKSNSTAENLASSTTCPRREPCILLESLKKEVIFHPLNGGLKHLDGSSDNRAAAEENIKELRYGFIYLHDLVECTVMVSRPTRYLYVQGCRGSTIFVPCVTGVAFVSASTELRLSMVCRSCVIENCYDIQLNLHSLSRPILSGDIRGALLGPFNVVFSEQNAILRECNIPSCSEATATRWSYPLVLGPSSGQAPLVAETVQTSPTGIDISDNGTSSDRLWKDTTDPSETSVHPPPVWTLSGSPCKSSMAKQLHTESGPLSGYVKSPLSQGKPQQGFGATIATPPSAALRDRQNGSSSRGVYSADFSGIFAIVSPDSYRFLVYPEAFPLHNGIGNANVLRGDDAEAYSEQCSIPLPEVYAAAIRAKRFRAVQSQNLIGSICSELRTSAELETFSEELTSSFKIFLNQSGCLKELMDLSKAELAAVSKMSLSPAPYRKTPPAPTMDERLGTGRSPLTDFHRSDRASSDNVLNPF